MNAPLLHADADAEPLLAIVIPVRDERATIGRVLAELPAAGLGAAEVIVVDDGSRDGSGDIARAMGYRVVRHPESRGYGAALKTGIAVTRAPAIGIIDSDGTLDPADFQRLRAAFVPGGLAIGVRREPARVRRLLKALFRLQVRLLTGRDVPDLNSGLRIFDRALILKLWALLPARFSFTTTSTLGALALSAPVSFVPVHYGRRVGARSKFAPLDVLRFARTVTRGCGWIRRGGVALPGGVPAPVEGPPDALPAGELRPARLPADTGAHP